MIGEPPVSVGAVIETIAVPSPADTVKLGAAGDPIGVTALVAADSTELPTALVAWTVKV